MKVSTKRALIHPILNLGLVVTVMPSAQANLFQAPMR